MITVRSQSTRLPEKCFLPFGDCSVLEHIIRRAKHFNINPIVCIGETSEEKNKNLTKDILYAQISKSIPNNATKDFVIIAYEPIWAIGTGLTPSLEEIDNIHSYIKNEIQNFENYKILYGGSVNSNNASEIMGLKNVDGVLVGGASLDALDYKKIINS